MEEKCKKEKRKEETGKERMMNLPHTRIGGRKEVWRKKERKKSSYTKRKERRKYERKE